MFALGISFSDIPLEFPEPFCMLSEYFPMEASLTTFNSLVIFLSIYFRLSYLICLHTKERNADK